MGWILLACLLAAVGGMYPFWPEIKARVKELRKRDNKGS